MARLCGDGGYTIIVSDVMVKPEFQSKGIGKNLMAKAMEHIRNNLEKEQEVFVNLVAAKNKEPFYKRFGFEERPNDKLGAGMTQWIKYEPSVNPEETKAKHGEKQFSIDCENAFTMGEKPNP
jgi:N-acetylglutamate synthase-like GNAT family acetyltransferase